MTGSYFVELIPIFLQLHFYEPINWDREQIQRSMAIRAHPMKFGIHLNYIRSKVSSHRKYIIDMSVNAVQGSKQCLFLGTL
jgi:hypothetical protein